MSGFFDRAHSIAPPDYSRSLIPPAALAVHLSIGSAYAFSTFNLPLTHLIGGAKPAPGDWTIPDVLWIFSLAILVLGVSAAVFGRWVERVGPRKAMFVAACCFGGGFLMSAVGVVAHQLWVIYLGYGLIGGCGLGLGYIGPVSTLIKWFPDRPGMATGIAIMGFGGGAFIAGPLSVSLMAGFKSATSSGVAETFVVMGIAYFVMMTFGALIIRLPAPGWTPAGWTAPAVPRKMVTTANVEATAALRTPQFYLLWIVLCMNVTAGIAVISQASPMLQESFKGVSPAAAAGFVGMLSLFNMAGRFFWSSISDLIGRKSTYVCFFVVGIALYWFAPKLGDAGELTLFVLAMCVILSMYGGGFATIPAYLKDIFGGMQVGAIHGVLLTAWSAAGVLGPLLIGQLRAYEASLGMKGAELYATTLHVMCGLLLVGLIANLFMSPVHEKHHYQGALGQEAN
jgi:MFS family permease